MKLTPEGLAREVSLAERFMRKHLDKVKDLEQRFVGNWFSTDWSGDPTPENLVFGFLAHMLPELCYAKPACRIRPKRVYSHAEIADAVSAALATWFEEIDFLHELQDCVRDALTGWGVGMVGMEDRDHGDRQPRLDAAHAMRPFFQHLDRGKFFMDPRAKKPKDARFMGHRYKCDLDDLPMYEQFDPAAVDSLVASRDGDTGNSPTAGESRDSTVKPPEVGDRNEVTLVDVWVRDNNTICTLAWSGDSPAPIFVRQPTPYDGPPDGPYVVFGFYSVFNDPYPMGPLQPVMEQIEELQAHVTAASDEASTFKNITLVDAANPDATNAVQNGKNGYVYPIKGLNANTIVSHVTGQVHPQRMEHIFALRDRVDRVCGLGDNQRGRITNATASESQIVQSNVDLRIEYLRGRIERGVWEILRKVVHYLFYSPLAVMPVERANAQVGGKDEGTYYGGQQPGQENIDWVDFYLEIIPASMNRADDQQLQQTWVECITMATQVAQGMASMPFINWRYMFDQWGETWNQKHLSDVIFNPAALTAFAQDPRLYGMGMPMPVPANAGPMLTESGLGLPALPPSGAATRRPSPPGGSGMAAAAPQQQKQQGPKQMVGAA